VKGIRKNDLLFFVTLFFLMALFGGVALRQRERISSAVGELVIQRPGETLTVSLDKDRKFSIGTHTVEISGGRVRVTEASCPLKICEKQGWVTEGVIICAPNRTALIVRPAHKEGYDVITQ